MGGKDVEAEAVAASESAVIQRTSILAIDTSDSMRGTRIAEAKKAALAYLAAVPANVQVGVLTFDDTVDLARATGAGPRRRPQRSSPGCTLTREHLPLRRSPRRARGRRSGRREGRPAQDPGALRRQGHHRHALGRRGRADRRSKAQVNVVSLQRGDEANAPLNAIADAGKGTMLTAAEPAALTAAFAKEADALARQIVVTAQVPADSDETSSNVLVTVPTADETFTASAYVPVRTAADIAAEKASQARPQAGESRSVRALRRA